MEELKITDETSPYELDRFIISDNIDTEEIPKPKPSRKKTKKPRKPRKPRKKKIVLPPIFSDEYKMKTSYIKKRLRFCINPEKKDMYESFLKKLDKREIIDVN